MPKTKEAIPEVDQELKAKISNMINNNNSTCLNSSMLQISIHLLRILKISNLDRTNSHLETTALEANSLHNSQAAKAGP